MECYDREYSMSPFASRVNAAEDHSSIGNKKNLFTEMIRYYSQNEELAECKSEHGREERM